ncbi:hypothetical protein LSH36_108g07131 [Paralvinella palmiformis]|uniref:DUF155 domain-containing protein n=1 Tax=Paralvinella palmiformis TaxID=53620 RepID=A0AAD9JYQ4_9ANNE|nr:hypothetical protein LSH36_108g07131 [Paralvinella palmiformis]
MMLKSNRIMQICNACKGFSTSLLLRNRHSYLLLKNSQLQKNEVECVHRSPFFVSLQRACYCSVVDMSQADRVYHAAKRATRKKKSKDAAFKDKMFDVMAYSTADKYNLLTLREKLKEQGLYGYVPLPSDMSEEALHVESLYGVEEEPRGIFFFKDGATVFWNTPQVERSSVLKFLRRHQEKPYDEDLVYEEYDRMHYVYQIGSSQLNGDEILLRQVVDKTDLNTQRLEKYAFSNALALSVSLSIWEAMLDQYVESIEFILQDLKDGKNIKMTERDVLRKAGHLLTLRHLINLRSDLLDPPDAYWDREDLESIYIKTCQYLDIARRTRVMNEKLNHCTELMTMLQELLKDKHHTRLEWMIIILIMIEVRLYLKLIIPLRDGRAKNDHSIRSNIKDGMVM